MIQPYYQDSSVTIYNADCREILPQLEPVDLVLTDPPYGRQEARKNHRSRCNPKRNAGTHSPGPAGTDYGVSGWDDVPPDPALTFALRTAGKIQIIFGGNYFTLPPSPCWLVWDKDNGESDFVDCELAWTNLHGAIRKFRWRWSGMIQEVQDKRYAERRVHPTQKPTALMKWCISLAGAPKTILDPFMGSGTTLRAAKDLGLKAIGIEIEERYCEIAAKRMSQEVLQFAATGD